MTDVEADRDDGQDARQAEVLRRNERREGRQQRNRVLRFRQMRKPTPQGHDRVPDRQSDGNSACSGDRELECRAPGDDKTRHRSGALPQKT